MIYLSKAILFLLSITASLSVVAANIERPLTEKLAIIVNANDPESLLIADYYQKKRNIPDENIIIVEFAPKAATLNKVQFQKIYQQVQDKTPKHVQFYALAWRNTFRVSCMSITSAFAFGFDKKYKIEIPILKILLEAAYSTDHFSWNSTSSADPSRSCSILITASGGMEILSPST